MQLLVPCRAKLALLWTVILAVSACSDGNRPATYSQVEIGDGSTPPVAACVGTAVISCNNPVKPGDTLTLVWSEEFDAALNPNAWLMQTGDGTAFGLPAGWGNNELQFYQTANADVANGVLSITAREETVGGNNYTSARITTQDRFAFRYGRIEASIKLPPGQGLWPAFWMLSQDSPYGSWAATGEIDIVEAVNLDGTGGNEIFSTIHHGGEFPNNTSSETRYTPSVDVTDDFRTYAMEWDEFEIRWYIDGTLFAMQNSWTSSAAPYPAPFDQPFHILLNVAVGGNFPGSPNATTVFPAVMEVDYVRVYSGEP
ncbi:MAG: glycoside hydrolase family 16 protein [Gammaproteobacteria bacterium]|nr:glycoside hydrolase family 16 protein [Gammaproteobacteria bacterium]